MDWDADCAIIGGGPGGLIAALYLRRFRRKVVLFNSGRSRASWGKKIHNLIGFPRGISGKFLLSRINRQLDAVGGLRRIKGEAKVRKNPDGFRVSVAHGHEIKVKTVILATGIEDFHPQIQNLTRLRNLGLLKYCSICDGYEMRNEPVAVLAKDSCGIQKALFIGNWTKNMTIIVPQHFQPRGHQVKAIKQIGARVLSCIELKLRATPDRKGLRVYLDHQKPFLCRVVYVELGCRVKDSAFSGLRNLRRTKEGFITTTAEQRTTVPGIFAIGDCVNLLGQVSVAAGQAAVAATAIHEDLLTDKKT